MDIICQNLEAIDESMHYYDALVVHTCSFYVLFHKKGRRETQHGKKERFYKIRKFSFATNNSTWNCVEEIQFTLRSLDLEISSLLIYQNHFYMAITRKDVSSMVKYSMTGNLIENIITFEI